MQTTPCLTALKIEGYRPFKELSAQFGRLEVLVGSNGSGKSSLFEFLKFLRNGAREEIPPEIVSGSIGQQIFFTPGPERFRWSAEIDFAQKHPIRYEGELVGPVGRTHVTFERVTTVSSSRIKPFSFLDVQEQQGFAQELEPQAFLQQKIDLGRSNQLALSTMTNPVLITLYNLREYIRGWRFYSSFKIANEKIRKSVPIEQEPVLHEDAGNLSSLLHYLMTEHQAAFDELQHYLRATVPGFKSLRVKARGGPGEVIAFWEEEGVEGTLSLADLSDGILRLLCWIVICVQPNPPPLICIDEPDQGLHPRTLPVLAGLFEKACQRTQILLATHASYFLLQFDLSRVAVMRKEEGQALYLKPKNSKILTDNLDDFGAEELEAMHKSDELEKLA